MMIILNYIVISSQPILLTILVSNFILSSPKLENIDLFHGQTIKDRNIPLFEYDSIFDEYFNSINSNILKNDDYYVVAYTSPYLCGGCGRVGINFLNNINTVFPEKVILLISSYYKKDTIDSIKEIKNQTNIKILIDKNGLNVEKFKNSHPYLNDAWLFIVKNNIVQYVLSVDYNTGPKQKELFYKEFKKLRQFYDKKKDI